MKIVTEFASLLMVEYSKFDSESFVSNSFSYLTPAQILQVLETVKPDRYVLFLTRVIGVVFECVSQHDVCLFFDFATFENRQKRNRRK